MGTVSRKDNSKSVSITRIKKVHFNGNWETVKGVCHNEISRLFKKVLSIWGWRIENLVETKLCISELKENLKMLTAHRLDEY